MPSVYDCVVLAEDIYEASIGSLATGEGWTRVSHLRGSDGFFSALYRKGNDHVVAFRGTDDLEDLIADAQMAPVLNRVPQTQVQPALKFYDACCGRTTGIAAVTGHSLGGALAKVVSQQRSTPGIAFNAPYVGTLRGVIPMTSMLIRNYNAFSDPVSGVTSAIGRMEEGHTEMIAIAPPSFASRAVDKFVSALLTRGIIPTPVLQGLHYHSIEQLRKAIATKGELRKPLSL